VRAESVEMLSATCMELQSTVDRQAHEIEHCHSEITALRQV
jgi:hypothetical protein